MRRLLHHKVGPSNFVDLRTTEKNGWSTTHASYHAAAVELGLLHDLDEINDALDEAHLHHETESFRQAFVQSLTFCRPNHPQKLYDRHQDHLAEDLLYRLTGGSKPSPQHDQVAETIASRHRALKMIVAAPQQRGYEIQDDNTTAGTVTYDPVFADEYDAAIPIADRTDQDDGANLQTSDKELLQEQVETARQSMTDEQGAFYDAMVTELSVPDSDTPRLHFLSACGGSGKTFVTNTLLKKCRSMGLLGTATAGSGIAATLLDEGRTYHSSTAAPIEIHRDSHLNVTRKCRRGRRLIRCSILVIDEVSMLSRLHLSCLERSLRILCKSDVAFAGKLTLFTGDYRQCLPIMPRGSPAKIIDACFNASPLWNAVIHHTFTTNMRLMSTALSEEDRERRKQYGEHLLRIGDGIEDEDEDGAVAMPQDVNHVATLQQVVDRVYDGIHIGNKPAQYYKDRCILTTTNDLVDENDDVVLRRFPGESHHLYSDDTVRYDGDVQNYSPQFLNSLSPSGLPPHDLHIKIGCVSHIIVADVLLPWHLQH